MDFDLIYPDVLGAVTNQRRFHVGDVQYNVGIFPRQAFINQPIEIVILLQNTTNGDTATRVRVSLPNQDHKGKPVKFVASATREVVRLRSAEVGVLRLPIMAAPPTRAGRGYPIQVHIENSGNANAKRVRPPDGGPPPSVVAVSPFHINVLQDVHFAESVTNNTATLSVDIASKALQNDPGLALSPHYETLWSIKLLREERKAASEKIALAQKIAQGMFQQSPYQAYIDAVQERFGQVGQPLHPAEARAIARMLYYTTEDADALENAYDMEKTRWFKQLCQLLAHDEGIQQVPRDALFANNLLDAIIYDACHLAFSIVQSRVKENLGNMREQAIHTDKLLRWLNGGGTPDLNYVYMPLVLGGLIISPIVRLDSYENPWVVVDGMREALDGRKTLQGDGVVVFDLTEQLMQGVIENLKTRRIERP
jgi:hypothetical protein